MLRQMSKDKFKGNVLNDKDMNKGRRSALPPKTLPPKSLTIGRNSKNPVKAMTPIDHQAAQKKLSNILEQCKSNETDSHHDMIRSLPSFKEGVKKTSFVKHMKQQKETMSSY